jgi:hypothetical protein
MTHANDSAMQGAPNEGCRDARASRQPTIFSEILPRRGVLVDSNWSPTTSFDTISGSARHVAEILFTHEDSSDERLDP